MPALTEYTQAEIITKVAQALMLKTDMGLTVTEACKMQGITTGQFYRWLADASDLAAQIRQAHQHIMSKELAMIMLNRAEVLEMVIADALKSETYPEVRLMILQHLESRLPQLLEATAPIDNSGIMDILGPPKQVPGTSRFTAGAFEIEETDGALIVRTHQPEIIDITPQDPLAPTEPFLEE